ncbi:MAG: penicillin acylase family protein [Acetobacterales bacterium]
MPDNDRRIFARRPSPALRWLRRFAVGLVVLTVLAVGAFAAVAWLALPDVNGTVSVARLGKPVRIVRDGYGVPHIFAESETDGYFALGYAHAQDRMFQMDFMRRLGAGRLSEVLGSNALSFDRFMRVLGLYRLAEQSVERLGPEVRGPLEAYAAGVNALLERRGWRAAPEFAMLGYGPEPWRPADSLVWGRMMGMQLSNNWRDELMRAALGERLSPEQLHALWPPEGDERPLNIPVRQSAAGMTRQMLAALPPGKDGDASNVWALAGRHTASGKPLLANDPHLAFTSPVLWYLARIVTPERRLVGATAPGVPFVLIGHNERIAWGFTTTHSDTQDLFVERLEADDGVRYLTPDGPRAFETRTETIRVRWGEPVTLDVRATRHGPVISDVVGGASEETVLALASTALAADDRTPAAIRARTHAGDGNRFLEALAQFDAPQQNVFYADVEGNIGFVVPGKVPLRRNGDGFAPVPGWSGEYDWTGYAPYSSLPRAYNPSSGRIYNANNRVVPPDFPVFLSREWPGAYRARRIDARLAAAQSATPDDMIALQYDTVSLAARDLLPLLTAVRPDGVLARQAVAMLRDWHGEMDSRRAEPLIYVEWMRHLNRRLFADELGDVFPRFWAMRPALVENVLTDDGGWCDDVATEPVEDCTSVVLAALDDTVAGLTERFGEDPRRWLWGNAHIAHFAHPVFRLVPGLDLVFGNRLPTSGSDHTVMRGTSRLGDPDRPYRHVHGAGFRAVFDLADLDRSRFVIAAGQSGNPFSGRFDDMMPRWESGRFVEVSGSEDDLAVVGQVLRLVPR